MTPKAQANRPANGKAIQKVKSACIASMAKEYAPIA